MSESQDDATKWDEGCQTDQIRNDFVIPEMAAVLNHHAASRILDLGAATGYIARKLQSRLLADAHWTLVDTNASRLEIAKTCRPEGMQQDVVIGTLDTVLAVPGGYDAVIVSFTFLEIDDVAGCARQLATLMAPTGILLVVLPDVWEDVLKASAERPEVAKQFLIGPVDLPKEDRFTRRPYPFRTIRLEGVIAQVLEAGFSLSSLKRSSAQSGVYVLVFGVRT